MEEEKKLTNLIPEEDFQEKVNEMEEANYENLIEDFEQGILHLRDYSGVRKFKSIRRAIKRGHVSIWGDVFPKRPFNNRKRDKGSITYTKRRLYEQFTHKNRKVS
jgi:hypothetical protein